MPAHESVGQSNRSAMDARAKLFGPRRSKHDSQQSYHSSNM
jgi:hypothetical protein